MAWTLTDDLDTFRTAAGDFLRARPDRNTVLLSVTASLVNLGTDVYGDAPPLYGWWRPQDGPVAGAFLRTPPYPAVVSPLPPEAVAALPDALWDARADGDPPGDRKPVGVRGPQHTVEAYVAEQVRRTGTRPELQSRERLFRLGTLCPPHPAPPGRARPATAADRGLLLTWFAAFRHETGFGAADQSRLVDSRIADGRLLLWEVDSEPVSLAGTGPPSAGSVRIGPVYTPAGLRGRGYAAAATAALSQNCLDAGYRYVLLFTDLANPTSNALYRRLGYAPVEDYLVYAFTSGSAPPDGR